MGRGILCNLVLGLVVCLGTAARADSPTLLPHVVLSSNGKLVPADGYTWVSTANSDLRVRWQPGKIHSKHPFVLASEKEGVWQPAAGYQWLNNTPGDFRVVRGTSTYRSPNKDQMAAAVTKLLFAATAHHVAMNNNSKPSLLKDALVAGLLRSRDELIESAVTDLFPGIRDVDARTVRRAASLALDGQLNERNWNQSTAREEMIAALKKYDSNLGMAVDANEFVVQLMAKRRR